MWAVDLVAGQSQVVDWKGLDVNVELPGRLRRIGVEQRASCCAESPDGLNRLEDSCFVVHPLDRHEAGWPLQCALNISKRHHARGIHSETDHLYAGRLQVFAHLQDG